MYTFRILLLCAILPVRQCRSERRKVRAIDYPMQWRPVVQMGPSAAALHLIPGGGGVGGGGGGGAGGSSDQHLISITNFDSTNKAQLSQIAHHNAQILRHIKRVPPGVPVTQYHNPFPMSATGSGSLSAEVQPHHRQQLINLQSSPHHHHHHHHSPHHQHAHHSLHSAAAGGGGSPLGPGKHFIVQTSNVVVHPPPPPVLASPAVVASLTTPAVVHSHPNSLLTSSSNMAQTLVPFSSGGGIVVGHNHKHQYFSGKQPPPFLLPSKAAELAAGAVAGGGSSFKFLNAIHPSTTAKASGAKNYASAALIKSAVSMQPIFSSTTSRMPIIRDSTLTPMSFNRHTTVKPHPVVGKLQSHLSLANRVKPSGPGTAHGMDELAAHQSHLISSLAQFGSAPNFVRDGQLQQQKLPRPSQGSLFAPLPPHDHPNQYLGKNTYANHIRFPFSQQQHSSQQHQHIRAQLIQQQQLQHQQQQQQHHAHLLQQQDQMRQRQQYQQEIQQQQQLAQHEQQQQKHHFQQQQQQVAFNNHQQQQQQSQQDDRLYLPPGGDINSTKPVFEANQSLEQVLRDFDIPFKQMPAFGIDNPTTRSPTVPPSQLPFISPSDLSPFFQQIQQQQQQQQQQHHRQIGHGSDDGNSHSGNEGNAEKFNDHQSAERPSYFIASTFAPLPQHNHQVVHQYHPAADDFTSYQRQPHNLSFHHNQFPSEVITYHHQQLDTPQHIVPPFTRLEDEFSLNLVPPPSYAKDSSQLRRPTPSPASSPSRGPPSTAFPHLQPNHSPGSKQHHRQQAQHQHSAETSATVEHNKALDILNKYNIPAISPLQDANQFAYSGANRQHSLTILSSSTPPPLTTTSHGAVQTTSALTHFTSDKPNVFRHLNRPVDSEYKQHKVMHPSYTGGPKRLTFNNGTIESNSVAQHNQSDSVTSSPSGTGSSAVTHNFFTIEDAVTLSPPLSQAHRNVGLAAARPTATHNQIEASLNRPHEEEITEVITMRATYDDEEYLLQHLDGSTPSTSTATTSRTRVKQRRRRPRPSSSSTSSSTTSSTDANTNAADADETDGDADDQHQVRHRPAPSSHSDEQGQWETIRVHANHRETPVATNAADKNARTRSRTRPTGGGRPTVTVLQESGIVLEKPIRSRRPSSTSQQQPQRTVASDDYASSASRSRTAPSTTTTRTATTRAASVSETTEPYGDDNNSPTTIDLRDNIFLANLKQRRRPPHSTRATTFASSSTISPSPPSSLATNIHQQQTTASAGSVTEIGEDTFMTTRATRPATTVVTQQQTASTGDNDIRAPDEFDEEITLASDIAQTVADTHQQSAAVDDGYAPIETHFGYTNTNSIFDTALPAVTTTSLAPSASSIQPAIETSVAAGTSMILSTSSTYGAQFIPTETPVASSGSPSKTNNHRFRHRLRPKHSDNSLEKSNGESHEHSDENGRYPPTQSVNVRLTSIKAAAATTPATQFDSTTTRTTSVVNGPDDDGLQSTPKNQHRLNSAVIQKFDPKNRPRFSVKDYRQRQSSSSSTSPSSLAADASLTTPSTTLTTRQRYPTRSRVLPDLRIKPTRANSHHVPDGDEPSATHFSGSTERSSADDVVAVVTQPAIEATTRKRFPLKERRNKSTASNEVISTSERSGSNGYVQQHTTTQRNGGGSTTPTTPPVTSSASRGSTTRSRQPTSRRTFGGSGASSTTPLPPVDHATRIPTIRKYPNGGPPLRRPPQPSLRQRIAISQQKKASSSTELNAESVTIAATNSAQMTTPSSINKLFNVEESDNSFTPARVDNMNVDDIDMSDSVNTENYKLETAIMKIAKDDHSYRHSSITPRSRSRSTPPSSTSTTESMFFGMDSPPADVSRFDGGHHDADDEANGAHDGSSAMNHLIDDSPSAAEVLEIDMNGSPSDQSQRVADLTARFGNSDHFQSVNTAAGSVTSRRQIPGYFTLATEDPILPIEAFFPKMSNGNSLRG